MAKAQLKLLLYLIVLGVTLGCMAVAWYIYIKVLAPERRLRQEMSEIKRSDMPRIDPGMKRFEAAADMLNEGRVPEAREAMFRLIQQFPDSASCGEAKRIIGEINMDELFSTEPIPGKRDYIVQPGDSLALIASRQGTTTDMLIRLNGLMSTTLHPGDHLTLMPLEFNVVVDASEKTVTLRRVLGGREFFFKEYKALDMRLPAGVKPPAEMEVRGKSAVLDGRSLLPADARYMEADKWLPGSRSGVVLRTPPPVRAIPVTAPPAPGSAPQPQAASSAPAPMPQPPAETGVFLAREDLEEIFILVRNGSKLYIIR